MLHFKQTVFTSFEFQIITILVKHAKRWRKVILLGREKTDEMKLTGETESKEKKNTDRHKRRCACVWVRDRERESLGKGGGWHQKV